MEISAYFLSMKRNCSLNSIELPLVWYFTGATAYTAYVVYLPEMYQDQEIRLR